MLATVSSVTSANRIKRWLNEAGVFSSVIQTPQALTKDGCGYSLRFDESVRKIVEAASFELGIKIRAFYTETEISGKRTYIKA